MPHLLFFHESNAMGRDLAYIDRLLNMFGLVPIVIDPSRGETHYDAHFYPTLTDAISDPRWDGYTWVWLDHEAPQTLDEVSPPSFEEVIYCIGSDVTGFGGEAHPGMRVKLANEMVSDQTYATLVIPAVCGWHRWRRIG